MGIFFGHFTDDDDNDEYESYEPMGLRSTEISTVVPCETEPCTFGEAMENLRMLSGQRIFQRMAEAFATDEIEATELGARKLMVLDRVFREVQPRTIISTSSWPFGLIAWLFCPSVDELVTFGEDVRGEITSEILNEVLFNRFVLGDVMENLMDWREGAEMAWLKSADHLPAILGVRGTNASGSRIKTILVNGSMGECGSDLYDASETDAEITILRLK